MLTQSSLRKKKKTGANILASSIKPEKSIEVLYNHKKNTPKLGMMNTVTAGREFPTESWRWWHRLQMTVLVPVGRCSNINSEDALELGKSKVDLSLID